MDCLVYGGQVKMKIEEVKLDKLKGLDNNLKPIYKKVSKWYAFMGIVSIVMFVIGYIAIWNGGVYIKWFLTLLLTVIIFNAISNVKIK